MIPRLGLASVGAVRRAGFDAIIDVRSPSEFAEDHLPGAISLPVLDDAERARVGTIYKQIAPFEARKLGAALVAANAARHIAGPLAVHGGAWKPLVYCWRGGQRSGAFASILAQIGWRVALVEGGYKSWRHLVVQRMQDGPMPGFVVLDGNTGSGKTAILGALARRGVQVLDLEGLANHRGSLFGAMPGGQPAQTMFEGRLALAIEDLDFTRPVVVEAESSRIGERGLPRAVWAALTAAPRIRIEVPLAERARFTAATYDEITADPAAAEAVLDRMTRLHAREVVAGWRAMARARDWAGLAEVLMRDHYDPRYGRHRDRYAAAERAVLAVPRLDAAGLDEAAARIEAVLAVLDPSAAAPPAAGAGR